ncbi:unnamed protein product [Lactuca virosa]|uniref:Leucine-rich repeat-containing N-terminal plant-type domain-containing protein n=1 Tax=Lactuca virosa TaxID=75947 RepID=A0AAU9MRQ1_9ASTR|nr:unnamed protein product [Lactuca virosa]
MKISHRLPLPGTSGKASLKTCASDVSFQSILVLAIAAVSGDGSGRGLAIQLLHGSPRRAQEQFQIVLEEQSRFALDIDLDAPKIRGSKIMQYPHLWQQHLDNLVHLFSVGRLKVAIDPKSFVGVQFVADAVEYPTIHWLKNAKHFHLADNHLSGDIRSELFRSDMTLIHVIFNNNQLSGNIPSSIGLVSTLQALRLDSNSLDGIVPQNITNLKSFSKLYLSNNKLSGHVPNLTGMVSLFYVDMSNNSFDASYIPTWFTELPSLTTL